MLTSPRSRRLWGLGWMILVPALALGPGCSSRPENSPVVRKKFAEIASVQDQVADLAVQMKQMTAELAAMRKDVADSRSLTGGGEAVAKIEQIDARMITIEQEIGKINEAVNAGVKIRQVATASTSESTSAPTESASASETKSESRPAAASTSESKSTRSTASSSKPSTSRSTASSSSKSVPVRQVSQVTAPKPRGKYYTIKSGDSAESIAKSNGVSIDTLLRANRLPKDATIFPGQKLYVPAAN